MRKRLLFLNLFFIVVTALLIVRFFSLQVLSSGYFDRLAKNQHQLSKTINPVRGEIYIHDQKNNELISAATNIKKDLVFAVPHEIEDKQAVARQLAPVLELTEWEITQKLGNEESKWVPIKKELPESLSLKVRELNLPGIYLEPETLRFYPEGRFASHVLGFVGFEGDEKTGQYGVERYFEEELRGREGYLSLEKDTAGIWITGGFRREVPAEDGASLTLTLDRSVQFKAEEILMKTMEAHQADQVSMVVLEARTGKVLAMASTPSFDPNTYNKVEDIAVYRNPAVSAVYEPGSVFKPITMAAALDAGAVEPDTTYEDKGKAVIDGYTIKNSDGKTYGVQTMTEVLEKSLNTGIIFVQDELGPERFLGKIEAFGFGRSTGIGLPAEAAGSIANLKGGGDIHYATAAYGQGITVTVLQLAAAYATLANEGRLTTPYIVERVQYGDGRKQQFEPRIGEQVVSSRAANTVGAMLVSVVENGHGKRAGVPGFFIAGKTGTAQVARADRGGYEEDRTIGTFAGFGPIGDPRFVIVVRVDNPKTVRFAESTAAPAFGEMAQFLLNYFQIPPSR